MLCFTGVQSVVVLLLHSDSALLNIRPNTVIQIVMFVSALNTFYVRTEMSETCGSNGYSKDISCHRIGAVGDFPPLGKANKLLLRDSIFFIESSCTGGLNFRQACSVEAAAKAHPDKQINVLFLGPVSRECTRVSPISSIKIYENINFFRIYMPKFVKNTPVEYLFVNTSRILRSKHPVHHTSEILRFVTLYKYGGIYMDLDMIVVKPLTELPHFKNFAGMENDHEIGSAIVAFSNFGIGREITVRILKLLNLNYDPETWDHYSYGVMTEVLKQRCDTPNITEMSTKTCKGFQVYKKNYFYPISNWRNFFYNNFEGTFSKEIFAFHIRNSFSGKDDEIPINSLYAHLMNVTCPNVAENVLFIESDIIDKLR